MTPDLLHDRILHRGLPWGLRKRRRGVATREGHAAYAAKALGSGVCRGHPCREYVGCAKGAVLGLRRRCLSIVLTYRASVRRRR